MSKNIVIFSDGTGQEGGKGPNTNIYKLFSIIENRSNQQVTFYDAGLGTGWNKLTGNIAGMGISRNILECYRFIFDSYNITFIDRFSSVIEQFLMLLIFTFDFFDYPQLIYKGSEKTYELLV